jgi:hypothetical protein
MSEEQHEVATATTTAAEPRWGDPLDTIPPERQQQLRELADQQREWAAQEKPDPEQSTFKNRQGNSYVLSRA